MKKILLAAFVLFGIVVYAQKPPIKIKPEEHNFGQIKQNIPATYVFEFTNEGSKGLVIESAVAGCGCTTPEYPKEPIGKGKKGRIKVTYNAAAMGVFNKDVTVRFVGFNEPIVLKVSGEVVAEVKASAKKSRPQTSKSTQKAASQKH